jgi:exopolyphosphatase/guanosine-5'-triphosphate,3'-diphosphate pyrophosphatase
MGEHDGSARVALPPDREVWQQAEQTVTPRWEWRTFGESFGAAEELIGASPPTDDSESDEVYLLSARGENVKVRDGLMDIKVLRQVDRHGLERWEPVMKAALPLDAASLPRVFEALREPLPTLSHVTYSLDRILSELVRPSAGVRALAVHKRRVRHRFDGCLCELSEIAAADRRSRTLAVEAEDPEAVLSLVTRLGLRDRVNTNVLRGLAALVDDERRRVAVIDVGTNSVKFHLAEQSDDGTWCRLVDRSEVTRLGEGLAASGAISRSAMERTATAIAAMADEAKRQHASAIAAVGTAGLRSAGNRDDVVAAIDDASGVLVEPISGEEESRLAYLAVRAEIPLPDAALVVFDTGGGSSQFTFGCGSDVAERFSVEVGAVRYTERFGLDGAVSRDVLQAALDAIGHDLRVLDGRARPDLLVGMGGAVTNITAVELALDPYDPDAVQGATVERAAVDRQIELYRSREADGRRAIVGLQPKRAEVILAGACIVRTVMEKLQQDRFVVSDRGLRHGLLVERFGSPTGR